MLLSKTINIKKNIKKYIYQNSQKTIRFNPNDKGTLIGLPYRYTVPCASEMFQEMYYWDTYFTNVGLLVEKNAELAKNNVDNMLYMVEKYGFMPNGNRTFYLNQSQPPFLSQMVKRYYSISKKRWLDSIYGTVYSRSGWCVVEQCTYYSSTVALQIHRR